MLRRGFYSVVLLSALATWSFADGKVFSSGNVRVNIPDQSALLCFDGKTERLVIETAFDGKGEDFAWVVPLPSVPRIEPATAGLFPTLRIITRPRVISQGLDWIGTVFLLLLIAAILWMAHFRRSIRGLTALIVLLVLLAGLLFPALGTARGSSGADVLGVVIHSREQVGAYDTAVLSGEDGGEILAWLNDNNFFVPPESAAIMRDYAAHGWVFAAAKLRHPENAASVGATHPLSLTFETDRAVYPMRLTGVGNTPLSLQLFVVGDQEAQVACLERQRSASADVRSFDDWYEASYYVRGEEKDDYVPVAHESLRNYVGNGQTLTLLTGELSPEVMDNDLWVDWKQPKPYRKIYYMPEGAIACGALWGSAAFLLGTIVGVPFLRWRESARKKRPDNRRVMLRPAFLFLGVIVVAVLAGEIVYLSVPTAPQANLLRGRLGPARYTHENVVELIEFSGQGTPEERLGKLRATVSEAFDEAENPISGQPFTEEDSPFNYTLELVEGVPTYFYYNAVGEKIRLKSFPAGSSGEGQKPGGQDV